MIIACFCRNFDEGSVKKNNLHLISSTEKLFLDIDEQDNFITELVSELDNLRVNLL
jgi:hypothetical protein